MSTKQKIWFYGSAWLPVVLWCGVIFYLSHLPYLRIVEAWWDIILRKIAHVGEFTILARLFVRAFRSTTLWSWKKIFILSLICAVLYACSDEYHQTFVPGRVGCLRDVMIDNVGAWIGVGFLP